MLKNFLKGLLYRIFYKPGFPSDLVINNTFNPYFVRIGTNSTIHSPLRIDGGDKITIGHNSSIGKGVWLSAFKTYQKQVFDPKISIGDGVTIGNFACITAINEIEISAGCLLSEYVYISDHAHGFNPEFEGPLVNQPLNSKGAVRIGSNTFLGYRCVVLPGVVLGKNCVVGANSVVTKSFPDYSMIGGVPATLIKTYSFEKKNWI